MNLQQLEYIIAVDNHRHFGRAAEACFVSQPTLSMMIHKLEEELGARIFDRSRQPVVPTDTGRMLLDQARKVLQETAALREIVDQQQGVVAGFLHLGIIPTLAPYLLPLFIGTFLEKYPKIHLKISDMTTNQMVEALKRGRLDIGILVTPLYDPNIREQALFYEPFHVYTHHPYEKEFLLPDDINPNELLLLEEGHCLRSQMLKLCELRRQSNQQLQYEAGSIETLKQLVEHQQGTTILPELAALQLSEEQRRWLKPFQPPAPVREVSLVTHRDFVRVQLLDALRTTILDNIAPHMRELAGHRRIDIN